MIPYYSLSTDRALHVGLLLQKDTNECMADRMLQLGTREHTHTRLTNARRCNLLLDNTVRYVTFVSRSLAALEDHCVL